MQLISINDKLIKKPYGLVLVINDKPNTKSK